MKPSPCAIAACVFLNAATAIASDVTVELRRATPHGPVVTQQKYVGDQFSVVVAGLSPQATYRLDLWRQFSDERAHSWAAFRADDAGYVDTASTSANDGTYDHVDVDGLFWSLEPTTDAPGFPIDDQTACVVISDNDHQLATKCFALKYTAPGVVLRSIAMAEHGFVGQLALPAQARSRNVVVTISGSEGGLYTSAFQSAYLANQGVTSLAVGYFGMPGLPEGLERIPLEYFEAVFAYVKRELHPDKIILLGPSRGSELALLLASHYPEVEGVVGLVPGNITWGANTDSETASAWTWQGQDVAFLNSMPPLDDCADFHGLPAFCNRGAFERKLAVVPPKERPYIKVENINGPILLIGGEDDQIWPSCDFGAAAMQRLQEFKHPFADAYLCFAAAGHDISVPSSSTYKRSIVHPFMGVRLNFGGTPQAMGRANRRAWQEILKFVM